ncbi:MAG: hypothetical protein LUQ38_01510, partial [Methanotrichaceae archaeon]|nr:hypothetical protein [Methanotrichaceae archaeon]
GSRTREHLRDRVLSPAPLTSWQPPLISEALPEPPWSYEDCSASSKAPAYRLFHRRSPIRSDWKTMHRLLRLWRHHNLAFT